MLHLVVSTRSKRGRKPSPLPPGNILNSYDYQSLTSIDPFIKSRAHSKLYDACGSSFRAMRRWLRTYAIYADANERTLAKYVYSFKNLTQEVIDQVDKWSQGGPLTKEEVDYLIMLAARKKLLRCIPQQYSSTVQV